MNSYLDNVVQKNFRGFSKIFNDAKCITRA